MLQIVQQDHIADVHQLCHPSLFVAFPSEQESIQIRGPRCQSSRCNCSFDVIFSKYVSWHLVFFSFSLTSFGPRVESIFESFCQSSRREVCQSIRFRSLCQNPLGVSYQSTRLSSLYPQAIKLFKVPWQKMFDTALKFLGVDI